MKNTPLLECLFFINPRTKFIKNKQYVDKKGLSETKFFFFMHHKKSGKEKGKDEAENLKKIRKPDRDYG